jgi:DNA-binding MarR family transcriptional regulator
MARKKDGQKDRAGEWSALDVGRSGRRLDVALATMHLEVSGQMGLTAAEVLALEILGMHGALGPSELGRRLHMTTGAVTALLDRLEERGLVVRERHPTDRRRLLVHLTAKGRSDTFDRLRPMAGEVGALADSLSGDERALIGRFLDDLSTIVERHSGL